MFHYEAIPLDIAKLNEKGADGWEAVNVYTVRNKDRYGAVWEEEWVLMKKRVGG